MFLLSSLFPLASRVALRRASCSTIHKKSRRVSCCCLSVSGCTRSSRLVLIYLHVLRLACECAFAVDLAASHAAPFVWGPHACSSSLSSSSSSSASLEQRANEKQKQDRLSTFLRVLLSRVHKILGIRHAICTSFLSFTPCTAVPEARQLCHRNRRRCI